VLLSSTSASAQAMDQWMTYPPLLHDDIVANIIM
jgi:hypothetical protein